jgi:hypothetical protein
MSASGTLVDVAAERRRAAVLNGMEHFDVQPLKPASVSFDEAVAHRPNDIGHL